MVKVFVGCAPDGADAESCAVLEYTLRQHTAAPVEITWMTLSRDPASFWHSAPPYGWLPERWPTPFSAFRWAIPAACGFRGRALYMDSDMIVRADILDLWNADFQPGKIVMAKGGASWRFCVSLWDCEAARDHLAPLVMLRSEKGHAHQGAYFRRHPGLIQAFPRGENWNYLDCEDKAPLSTAKILHYTAMDTQPHLRHALPRLAAAGRSHWFNGQVRPHPRPEVVDLFDAELAAAVAAGFTVDRYVPAEVFGPFRKADLSHYRRGA